MCIERERKEITYVMCIIITYIYIYREREIENTKEICIYIYICSTHYVLHVSFLCFPRFAYDAKIQLWQMRSLRSDSFQAMFPSNNYASQFMRVLP